MLPRAVAPEKQVDLKAMRQLANQSATCALQKHDSKQLSDVARGKLAVMIVSLVIAGSLLGLSGVPGVSPSLTMCGAAASFAIAALWGANYLSLKARLTKERRAHRNRYLASSERPTVEVREEKTAT